MKTGLPRHLMMTYNLSSAIAIGRVIESNGIGWSSAVWGGLTFLPKGIAARSISTLAWARTSAEADMLTRKSAAQICQPSRSPQSQNFPPSLQWLEVEMHQLTLYSSLRSGRSQQAHAAHHEILKCLIPRFPFTAHVLRKVRYPRRRVLI